MLFYFTATGNSLYVAKQLEKKPFSIPQVIHQKQLSFEDEMIGIVCPIYAGEPPKIVLEFLKKAKFNTNYLYLILTYGKDDSDAPEYAYTLCQQMKLHVDYVHSILMVDNYLPSFDMNEQKALNKHIEEQIQKSKKDIQARKREVPTASQEARDFHAKAKKLFNDNPSLINGEQITVTDKCTGCSICAKVCPLGHFVIVDGKAVRTRNTCEFCLACAHACPHKAITTNISDKNPDARFRNEHIRLQDIIEANQQK